MATPTNVDGAMGEFDISNINGNNMMRYTAGNVGGELILATDEAQNIPQTGNYFVEAKIRPLPKQYNSKQTVVYDGPLSRYRKLVRWRFKCAKLI